MLIIIKKHQLLLLMMSIFFFSSCTEEVDFDLNDSYTRLIVEGGITDQDTNHLVVLTNSTSYFKTETSPPASGAIVKIKGGDLDIELTETPIGSGKYYTPKVQGVVGNTYTLTIDYKGEKYEAKTNMKRTVALDAVIVYPDPDSDDGEYLVEGWVTEPEGVGDFYMWHYSVNGVPRTDTLKNLSFVDDELVDGNTIGDYDRLGEKGYGVPIYVITDVKKGDLIEVKTYGIEKAYYQFLNAYSAQIFRGGLFDSPPANLPGNISNGAMGYFTATGVKTNTAIVSE